MAGLAAESVPVSWSPLGWPSDLWGSPYGPVSSLADLDRQPPELAAIAWAEIDHDTVVVCSTPLWHPLLGTEAAGRRLVAFTAWETDRLAPGDVEILNHFDSVIVPSRFVAEVLLASGVTVPLSAVAHVAPPWSGREKAAKSGAFTFYTIATWTTRKALSELIDAFSQAFDASDDVELVIHTTPVDQVALARVLREGVLFYKEAITTRSAVARAIAGRSEVPTILLSTKHLSREEIAGLHERGDCFVSLSRGEAWNLGAFEAAASGNPVVVTGWGGHLEYLPEDYPYLVGYDLVATTDDEPDAWWSPRPGEHWAKADLKEAAKQLREVYEERQRARELGAFLQEEIGRRYSHPIVTEALVEALERTVPRR
jgi:glycosyltransferase involved in cell wall biosynthesis